MKTEIKFPRTEVVDTTIITDYLNQVIYGDQPINARVSAYGLSPDVDEEGLHYYDGVDVLVFANKATHSIPDIPDERIREIVLQYFNKSTMELVHGIDGKKWYKSIQYLNSIEIDPHKSAKRNYEDADKFSNAISMQGVGKQSFPTTIVATYDVDSDEIKYASIDYYQFDEALATIVNQLETKYQSEVKDNQIDKLVDEVKQLTKQQRQQLIAKIID